jgi:hypothetical protein
MRCLNNDAYSYYYQAHILNMLLDTLCWWSGEPRVLGPYPYGSTTDITYFQLVVKNQSR